MSEAKSFDTMLVPELRAEAARMGVSLPLRIKKAEIVALLKSVQDQGVSAAPAPRKRGRPRKNPPPEANAPAVEAAPAEAPETAEPATAEPEPAKAEPVTVQSIPEPEPQKPEPAKAEAAQASPAHPSAAEPEKPSIGSPYQAMRARRQQQDSSASEGQADGVRRPVYERRVARVTGQTLPQMLDSEECGTARGTLEIQPDGYGFLRAIDPNQKDVYISAAQIRRFALRNGDLVAGRTRPERENERYLAMLYISTINGLSPEEAMSRPQFENLTPIYPDRRLRLENPDGKTDFAIRLLDLVAPIGYGQRGLIVSPPKAGKTTLLKAIAHAIAANAPDAELIVLLIDERPEEVTDMMRSVRGQVYYSTFDQDGAHHIQVAESTLEKARRSVENKKDVIILMDSITRLARASNLTCTPSGRLLSGGLDPAALAMPKRFFGSARCLEEGGSLTILATALIDTGSRLDDIIYEEFKGTGNMELHLDRKLQERRVFPAIDLYKSGTRHEENLLTPEEQAAIWKVRKLLSGNPDDATELLIDMMAKTQKNTEFITKLESWLQMMDNSYSRK